MPESVEKKAQSESPKVYSSSAFTTVLTHIVIRGLAPTLKCEILFDAPKAQEKDHKFGYWAEQSFTGELNGSLGLGVDPGVVRAVAKHAKKLSGRTLKNPAQVIEFLFGPLGKNLERQLKSEDFDVSFAAPASLKPKQAIALPNNPAFFIPVNTKYGAFWIRLALDEKSYEKLEDQFGEDNQGAGRKIRIPAQQLDRLYSRLHKIEDLETQLLKGAEVRNELRSEIKRVKRHVQRMKSEPLDLLYSPARKLIVEVAKQQGKQVRLILQGADTQLDKNLLNYLYTPILHLVRNAVDHGIESPAERERQGKPEVGTVRCMNTFTEGGLRMVISDDGRGLDIPRIRVQGVKKGYVDPQEAETKLASELSPLVFETGFTTREKPDTISGRGMGLSVVKKEVERLLGRVRMLSTSAYGTSFEVFIPLNADLSAKQNLSTLEDTTTQEQDDKGVLLEELDTYFDQLKRLMENLVQDRNRDMAYEAYRLVHSIRGIVGCLGWQRIHLFCHHLEDLLTSVTEDKLELSEKVLELLQTSTGRLQGLCDMERSGFSIPSSELRRLEGQILRALWSSAKEADKPNFSFGRHHVKSLTAITKTVSSKSKILCERETDFLKALAQPVGTFIQFGGDRTGYAGILMSEKCAKEMVAPLIEAKPASKLKTINRSQQTDLMIEFASMVGRDMKSSCQKEKIALELISGVGHHGGQGIIPILEQPTYGFHCQLDKWEFYLVGDIRPPQNLGTTSLNIQRELPFLPSLFLFEGTQQCLSQLKRSKLTVQLNENAESVPHIGFDDGYTLYLSCEGKQPFILTVSYDARLARYLVEQGKKSKKIDILGSLQKKSSILSKQLQASCKKNHFTCTLSIPTVFKGKLYVPHLTKQFSNNRVLGQTSRGRFEVQVWMV